MADGAVPYVFISYASVDRYRVLPVVSSLRAAGVKIWLDQESIGGGASYGPAISGALRDCHAVVVLCSAASLASRNVRQEIAVAWKHDRPLLPLLLEPVEVLPDEVEYWLEGAQWIEVLSHPAERWLPQVLRALDHLGVPVSKATEVSGAGAVSIPASRFQVPVPLTDLIGRREDLAAISEQIRAHRLVTLLGPGGTGKTRLAIAVATEQRQHFDAGVLFVNLTPIRDPRLVLQAVATTLEVRESGEQSLLDSLATAVGTRHMLLVLDNFEQVVEAAAEISTLLARCSALHILVTSRVPLHVVGEREYALAPLALPVVDRSPDLASLAANEAVKLFVERAAAVQPGFALNDENALAIAAICQRLDGLPLAIELASARVKMLSLVAILDRLERPLGLLVGGPRDLAAHQRTMRDTIAWTYDLLDPEVQALFRSLSVFNGGWSLTGIEAIGDGLSSIEPLDGLATLLEFQLIHQQVQPDGTRRFAMLEVIRQFGLEELARYGEEVVARQRHLRYATLAIEQAQAGQTAGHPSVAQDIPWLSSLTPEYDNLLTALSWAIESVDVPAALGLFDALEELWFMWSNLNVARNYLEMLLNLPELKKDPLSHFRVLESASTFCRYLGESEQARRYSEESLLIARKTGDQQAIAWALLSIGIMASNLGEHVRARALLQESLSAFRALDDATKWVEALSFLAFDYYHDGELDIAEEMLAEALEFARDHDLPAAAIAHQGLARIAVRHDEPAKASEMLHAAAAIFVDVGPRTGLAYTLEGMAMVWIAAGKPGLAALLAGAAAAFREQSSAPLAAVWQAEFRETLEQIRAVLSPAEWEHAWIDGQSLTPEQALKRAFENHPGRGGSFHDHRRGG